MNENHEILLEYLHFGFFARTCERYDEAMPFCLELKRNTRKCIFQKISPCSVIDPEKIRLLQPAPSTSSLAVP